MHLEALNQNTRAVFQRISGFKEFYLAGGTALALQIGHRISVDFDLFSRSNIDGGRTLRKLRKAFSDKKVTITLRHSEQISVAIDGVHASFARYPFPVLMGFTRFHGIRLVKVPEIAAMKAYALGRRPSLKDYVDLYFMISKKYTTLPQILKLAQRKYKAEFEPRLFLGQLIYLEDVEETPIQFLQKRPTKKQIELFFQEEIKKIKL